MARYPKTGVTDEARADADAKVRATDAIGFAQAQRRWAVRPPSSATRRPPVSMPALARCFGPERRDVFAGFRTCAGEAG